MCMSRPSAQNILIFNLQLNWEFAFLSLLVTRMLACPVKAAKRKIDEKNNRCIEIISLVVFSGRYEFFERNANYLEHNHLSLDVACWTVERGNFPTATHEKGKAESGGKFFSPIFLTRKFTRVHLLSFLTSTYITRLKQLDPWKIDDVLFVYTKKRKHQRRSKLFPDISSTFGESFSLPPTNASQTVFGVYFFCCTPKNRVREEKKRLVFRLFLYV